MGGYARNVAVIRELKAGFSADGRALSGIVKTECYAGRLKVEASFINFAPLSEGRYVLGITDGNGTLVVENGLYEGEEVIDTQEGFGALVCFIKEGVFPVAAAICRGFGDVTLSIKGEIERAERLKREGGKEDGAIAEVEDGECTGGAEGKDAVCPNEKKEETGKPFKDEEAVCAVPKEARGGLAGGDFYGRMRKEIEKIFATYPPAEGLEKVIAHSKWVRISYGDGKYYAFGIIKRDTPAYICYGTPTYDYLPPQGIGESASFIPCEEEGGVKGYWVTFVDADTGVTVGIDTK